MPGIYTKIGEEFFPRVLYSSVLFFFFYVLVIFSFTYSWRYFLLIYGTLFQNVFLIGLCCGLFRLDADFLFFFSILTLSGPQSRFGDKLLETGLLCPQNGTAVL